MVFLNGINFGLCGKSEHRELRWSDFQLCEVLFETHTTTNVLTYMERTSKNNQGGLLHVKVHGKVIEAFENVDNISRCPVALFLKYQNLCLDAEGDLPFYKVVVFTIKNKNTGKWYSRQPAGVNTLCVVVKNLCIAAGFAEIFYNPIH
jgi:hypothetical protein